MEVAPRDGLDETFEGRLYMDVQMLVLCDGRERGKVCPLPNVLVVLSRAFTLLIYILNDESVPSSIVFILRWRVKSSCCLLSVHDMAYLNFIVLPI